MTALSYPGPRTLDQRPYPGDVCNWCSEPITQKPVGRRRRWCSQRCRQRAYVYRSSEPLHDWVEHHRDERLKLASAMTVIWEYFLPRLDNDAVWVMQYADPGRRHAEWGRPRPPRGLCPARRPMPPFRYPPPDVDPAGESDERDSQGAG